MPVIWRPIESDGLVALFTDIVESSARLAAAGDRAWSDLLDRHDEAVRRELRRFGGREVKTTGDGILATFDNPTRALAGGRTIRDAAVRLGLTVRVGLHTGQVHVRGADVGVWPCTWRRGCRRWPLPTRCWSRGRWPTSSWDRAFAFTNAGEHTLEGVPGRWGLYAREGEPDTADL